MICLGLSCGTCPFEPTILESGSDIRSSILVVKISLISIETVASPEDICNLKLNAQASGFWLHPQLVSESNSVQ